MSVTLGEKTEGPYLSGTLIRDQNSGVTGGGSLRNIAVGIYGLSIGGEIDGVLALSGTASRNPFISTTAMLVHGELGSCVLVVNILTLREPCICNLPDTICVRRSWLNHQRKVPDADYHLAIKVLATICSAAFASVCRNWKNRLKQLRSSLE